MALRVPDVLALVFAVGAAAGCYRHPLVPFSLDTPPLILAPASLAGVTDGRGRFREIYCAIRAPITGGRYPTTARVTRLSFA